MKLLILNIVIITISFCSCKAAKRNDIQGKNEEIQPLSEIANTLIKSRQGKYRKKLRNPELDNYANALLVENFCPDSNCSEQDIKYMNVIKNFLRHPKTDYELLLERYYVSFNLIEVENIIYTHKGYNLNKIYPYPVDCKCYNAMAISLEKWNAKDIYLIEINNGLSLDIGELAKVSSRILPYKDNEIISVKNDDEIRSFIQSQKPTLKDFMVKVVGHLFAEPTPDDESLKIDKDKVLFYNEFFQSMKFFVIAHEYSHALLKHSASYSTFAFTPEFGTKEEVIEIAEYPNNEYSADSLAFDLLLSYSKSNTNPEIVVASAELWFMWLDIFQKSEQLVHGYYKGQNSHPSAKERRDYILRTFRNEIPKTSDYVNLVSTLDRSFNVTWDYISNKLEPAKEYLKKISEKNECFKKSRRR